MKKMLFAAFILLGYNFSCNKNDDAQRTNAELLIGNWKLIAMTYSPAFDYNLDGIPDSDVYAVKPPCEKDDINSFLAGGVWQSDEGPLKCHLADPQTRTGTWALSPDQQMLTVDGEVTTILQLDDTRLKFSYLFFDGGTTYTVTITLQKL